MHTFNKQEETLSKKEVELIVNAINHSKEQYKNMASERKLGFSNGKYLDRWNYIFANIRDSFNYESFITFPVSRGPLWEFIVIYNTDTKILYLLLKEDTFKKIRNDRNNPRHYVRIFNSKNSNYKTKRIEEQLSWLPKIEKISDKDIDEELKKMILNIKDEAKICKNILFTENLNGVTKISENIANYDLDILNTCDLTKHVVADIENIVDTKDNVIEPLPKIELNIRPNKIKRKEELISDKNKKDKEDKKKKKN